MALKPCSECRREVSTEAATCPHCGKADPTGTIQQREQDKRRADNRGRLYAFLGILGVIVMFAVFSGQSSSNGASATPNTSVSSGIPKARAESILRATSRRQLHGLPTPVLDSVLDALMAGGVATEHDSAAVTAATIERGRRKNIERETVIQGRTQELCHSDQHDRVIRFLEKRPEWDDETIAAVSCRRIHMGMDAVQVRAAWGNPEHINRTVVGNTTNEQWVYGSTYVYLDNDAVSSWQDER